MNKSHEKIDPAGSAKRVFLLYPPGPLYQRGEDRSQGNITDSAATVMRAPNDMGYAASGLMKKGFEVFFKDYPSENLNKNDLLSDFKEFCPSFLILSTTNSTVYDDLETVRDLKNIFPDVAVVLKGALFFDSPREVIDLLDLSEVDYLIGGEIEFSAANLIAAHFAGDREKISQVNGIFYREGDTWIKTDFTAWDQNIDEIPFPDRSLINNKLYVRPDTGRPQATINTSRGCPAACIYCLTPTISGKKVRFRTPDSILEELSECYHEHGIRDFFFKSDTFTIDRKWVISVCEAINNSDLAGKIEWVANSRVRPLAEDTLKIMRDAGCWLVAFGFESGNQETLKKIKKGATAEDNLRAAKLAKEAGLKLYGFFLIGLPWEDWEHLEQTKQHIFDIDADFIEVHIAVPYYGTELYNIAKEMDLIDNTVLGKDYFNSPTIGTKFIPMSDINKFRRKLLFEYHIRPRFIANKLIDAISQPNVLLNYMRFGSNLLYQNLPFKVERHHGE